MRITGWLDEQLSAEGLRDLFAYLEMPLLEVLADMEARGVRVDPLPCSVLRHRRA